MEGTDKGDEARKIRDIVHVGKMPNEETFKRIKNMDKLFAINETFMNITLRDFLNLNDDGTSIHSEPKDGEDGWKKNRGIFYHLNPKYSTIEKYENTDGRELIFGYDEDGNKRERLEPGRFADTYNYAAGTIFYTLRGCLMINTTYSHIRGSIPVIR
jgi:hypothetical protein